MFKELLNLILNRNLNFFLNLINDFKLGVIIACR